MKWWMLLQARSGYMNEIDSIAGGGEGGSADSDESVDDTEEDMSWFFEEGEDSGETGSDVSDDDTGSDSADSDDEGEEGEDEQSGGEAESSDEGLPEKEAEAGEEENKEVEKEEEQAQLSDEEIEQQRQQFLAEVEKDFAISEEDSNLLLSEPEKIMPKLMAKAYDRAMQDATKMISSQVQAMPQYLEQWDNQRQQQTKIYSDFLESNPALKELEENELSGLIETFTPAIKQRMGNASPEEKMKELGRAIAAYKGLSAKPAPKKQPKPAPAPKPHTPAAPAGSSVEGGKPKPQSDVEAWIMENLED